MLRTKHTLHLQFGAAMLAAPLFCLVYSALFGYQSHDIFWLFHDLYSLLLLILFYPVIEELAFRGMIQEFFDHRTKGKVFFSPLTVANLLTSALFVLMHFIHHAPVWAILTFFPSLLFGYFKEQYHSVLQSILLHIFYNLIFFSMIGNGG